MMNSTTGDKRKIAPHNNHSDPKRAKILEARTILAQTSDKALNKNGELDVAAFVKAREFEIKALEESMRTSGNALAERAFQQLPKELRRRTASHNVKKVPKRMRARAAKQVCGASQTCLSRSDW